jgi:hypothetical protein
MLYRCPPPYISCLSASRRLSEESRLSLPKPTKLYKHEKSALLLASFSSPLTSLLSHYAAIPAWTSHAAAKLHFLTLRGGKKRLYELDPAFADIIL